MKSEIILKKCRNKKIMHEARYHKDVYKIVGTGVLDGP